MNITTLSLAAAALQSATLTGVVRDGVDLHPVGSARITVTAAGGGAASVTVSSDRYGAFVVPGAPAGTGVRVQVVAYGYGEWTRSYGEPPRDPLRVLLAPAPVGLEGLEVVAGGAGAGPIALSRDAYVVDSLVIRSVPVVGEPDVLRATAVSPSASAVSDFASIPLVRGGASGETPVLLDGARLFNAYRMGGFLSAINADVVDRAALLPGAGGDGFAVGSLSGAFDITTRDGSRDRVRTFGALGLASGRVAVEGPLGDRFSYIVSGRHTWIGALTRTLAALGAMESRIPYWFRDLHGKVVADLGGVRRLSVSGYLGSEWFAELLVKEDFDYIRCSPPPLARIGSVRGSFGSDNAALSVHYRDRLGGGAIVDASSGVGRFAGRIDSIFGVSVCHDSTDTPSSRGLMTEVRSDVRVAWPVGRSTVTVGAMATLFDGDHLFAESEFDDVFEPFDLRRGHARLALHSSAEVPLGRGLSARMGLRADRFVGLGTTLAPFAELGYEASWWRARAGVARSHQALASMRNEESLLASYVAYDLLLPVAEGPVPRSTEYTVGWEGGGGGLRVRVDAYRRELENLRLPEVGNVPLEGFVLGDPALWEDASGSARGVEVSWSWVRERGLSVLGSYRWARVERTVGGLTYTPRFHRDHELEAALSWRAGSSSWSAKWSLRSGQPFTEWVEVWGRIIGGEYNAARLPGYTRLDLGWRRESETSWFGGGTLVPYVSVANLLNRTNIVAARPEHDVERGLVQEYRRQLPVVPSFGVEFRR